MFCPTHNLFKLLRLYKFELDTDCYHFYETDADIFKIFSLIFGQFPVFDWPPIFRRYFKESWFKLV